MSGKTRNLPTEIFITGNWDANTNTTSYNDALESGIGNPDEKYRVTVAGNTNLDGINSWALNDIAYFDYYTRTWQKIDNQTNSGVTGSGTLNYIPLWTPSGTQLGNSIITQSAGGNAIQIGTTFLVDNTAKQVGINKISSLAASLHIVGSGATSGTSSLIIQNATPTTLFEIKDDGQVSSASGYWQGTNKILYINPNSTARNLFVGEESGNNTLTNNNNVGVGFNTLKALTSGSNNFALGKDVLQNLTNAHNNIGIGSQALQNTVDGNANIAIGANSLYSATTCNHNVAIGDTSCHYFSTASFNVAIGRSSLMSNNTGSENVVIGYAAMDSCGSNVNRNTAIGNNALRYATSNYGVAIGFNALLNITSGHTNIGIGYRAGELIADNVTPNQTSDSSMYIGFLTKPSANGNTNEMVFGYNATGNGSNSVTLGNTSIEKTILQGRVGIGTVTPNSMFHNAGSVSETKITTVSTGIHTVLAAEYIFNCTGTCTIELPSIAATDIGIGKVYKIFAAEGVTVTVTPNGADTIDGAASATVIGWGMITLRCLSAGNWRVGD